MIIAFTLSKKFNFSLVSLIQIIMYHIFHFYMNVTFFKKITFTFVFSDDSINLSYYIITCSLFYTFLNC